MGHSLRQENPKRVGLITTRTQNSQLLFIKNKKLEKRLLTALAKYQNSREVILYAFVLMGNHYHKLAQFLKMNRAAFCRDFNAEVARQTQRWVTQAKPGRVWGKRYGEQELPREEDIEEYFFYCALQAVTSRLKKDPAKYDQYNSFEDAITGNVQHFTVTDWKRYNNAKRFNPNVDIERYQRTVTLTYSRLPGYEHLSQEAYTATMRMKYQQRREKLLAEIEKENKPFPPEHLIDSVRPGSFPFSTKVSDRNSYRPLVLCSCPIVRKEREKVYWDTRRRFKQVSAKYLAGDITIQFPEGTYRPPMLCQLPKEAPSGDPPLPLAA